MRVLPNLTVGISGCDGYETKHAPHATAATRYGPFWICATLVFVSAATGNAAAYLSYRNAGGQTAMWNYDVGKARAERIMAGLHCRRRAMPGHQ